MFHSIAGRSGKSELVQQKSELTRLKSELAVSKKFKLSHDLDCGDRDMQP